MSPVSLINDPTLGFSGTIRKEDSAKIFMSELLKYSLELGYVEVLLVPNMKVPIISISESPCSKLIFYYS